MRKTDKKRDKQLGECLTQVCQHSLTQYNGFQWLTHIVNYAHFPKSLKIVCVFDTEHNLNIFLKSHHRQQLNSLIYQALFKLNINIRSIVSHISYDTEERCQKEHNGNWAKRCAQAH